MGGFPPTAMSCCQQLGQRGLLRILMELAREWRGQLYLVWSA